MNWILLEDKIVCAETGAMFAIVMDDTEPKILFQLYYQTPNAQKILLASFEKMQDAKCELQKIAEWLNAYAL
jgi:N6-adenosine-specific RNA methylase IME4